MLMFATTSCISFGYRSSIYVKRTLNFNSKNSILFIRCSVQFNRYVQAFHKGSSSQSVETTKIKIICDIPTAVMKRRAMKRIHFENQQLFGPLLKSNKIREKELRQRALEPKMVNNDVARENELEERGFKMLPKQDVSEPTYKLLKIDLTSIVGFPIVNPWRPKALASKLSQSDEDINEAQDKIFPSVTKILNATMPETSRQALEKWKQNMIEKMGEDGFQAFQSEMLFNGRRLHESIARKLSGQDPDVIPANYNHWKSLELVFPKLKKIVLIEKPVRHKFLHYHGIVDCVATYKGRLVMIDWKTSKKQKTSLASIYDSPLQVAAYAGALNFDQRYKFQVDSAVIILAYENGMPAHIHYLDQKLCYQYWTMWLLRLKTFRDSVEANINQSPSMDL